MMRSSSIVLFLAFLVAPTVTQSEDPPSKLGMGAQAPPLHIARWVKGAPVERFEAGKVYLIEFWTTRSSDCLVRIPYLSQIQRAMVKDGVTVICIASDAAGDSLAAVAALAEERGDGIGFTVAWDDGKTTKDAYMTAAQRRDLPCTFVVDRQGRIAYVGRRWPELALAGIVKGDWEPKTGEERIVAAKARLKEMRAAVRKQPGTVDAQVALLRKDYPFALLTSLLTELEFDAHMATRALDKANAPATRLVDEAILAKDASTLNHVAWAVVDPKRDLPRRDLDLALRAAQKAVELTKEKNSAMLSTLARVWFWKQELGKAVAVEEKAVSANPRNAKRIKPTLDEYRAALEKSPEATGKEKK